MAIHDWALVDPGVFHDFHFIWLTRIRNLLNEEILPRPFYALAEPMVGEAEPDLLTLQASAAPPPSELIPPGASSGRTLRDDLAESAVALAPSSVVVHEINPDPYARKTRRILIRDDLRGDRIVATIEIISRGNKTSHARAEQCVRKTVSFLEKRVHAVVIDLQPPTPIVPLGFHARICEEFGQGAPQVPGNRTLSVVSYQALESGTIRAHFVPLRVRDPLPEMPVFLGPHEFVRLPLDSTYLDSFRNVPWKFQLALEPSGVTKAPGEDR